MSRFYDPQCRKHWRAGGTGITNFDADELPLYRAAVSKFNDPDMRIIQGEIAGSAAPADYSLHDFKRRKRLDVFWAVFNQVAGERLI